MKVQLQNFLRGYKVELLIVLTLFFLGTPLTTLAQKTQIGTSESFETDGNGSRYTSGEFQDDMDDFFLRLEDTDPETNGNMASENGTFYWVFGKVDVASNVNDPEGIMELDPIAITGYENLEVRLLLGTLGAGQYDGGDYLQVYAAIDGGGDVLIGDFTHNSGELRNSGTDLTDTFQPFTFPVSGTGNTLIIKVIGTNDSGSGLEQTTFDNIELFGNIATTSTTPAHNDVVGTSLSSLTLNYPENVGTNGGSTTGTITLTETGGPTVTTYDIVTDLADFSGLGTSAITLDISAMTLLDGETYEVDVTAGIFENGGGSSTEAITGSTDWTFTVDGIPSITSVTPPLDNTYIIGQDLDFTVNYDENVNVTGTPRIEITLNSGTVYANYLSGTGTQNIVFRYTVSAIDLDTDGITMVSPLDLNGGTIQDALPNDANLTFTPGGTAGILVDGVAPSIQLVGLPPDATYIAGQNLDFTVNYDENVDVTGAPRIEITLNSGTVYADYLSGTGSQNIVFRYTVVTSNLDANGIVMVSPIDLNGGTMLDANLNLAELTYTPGSTTGILVDAVAPSITSVTLPANDSYGIGQNLDFTVNYDENVDVTGAPRIEITLNSGTVYADYLSGTGTQNIVFRYTVVATNLDTDGIVMVSPIDLNGGTIQDAATNAADLTFTPGGTAGILVDGVPPSIASVTLPANNTYGIGQDLDFIVIYDENVDIIGTPRIEITLNSGTVYANYLSGTGSQNIVFRYTVVASNLDTDGIVMVSPIDLNGGTIQDAATNTANLTYTPGSTAGILVDGVPPSITSVTPPADNTYSIGQNLDFTVDFDENVSVTGAPRIEITLNSGTVYADYQSGTGTQNIVFRYTVVASNLDTDGIVMVSPIDLNGGTIQDAATTAANLTFTPGGTAGILVDGVAPEVSSIVRQNPLTSPTNATSVTFRVTFDEPVVNVDLADFALSGAANGTLLSVNPVSASVYDVTINLVSGNGNLNLDFAANNITDNVGNAFTGTITLEEEYIIDNAPPTINSITRADANPHNAGINAGNVDFTVTFNEPVNSVDVSDFTVSSTNLTAAPTVASVNAPTGTIFTITVNGFDLINSAASGSLNLNLNATGIITDDAGNDNVSDVVSGADETYTIINPEPADDIAPLTTSAQTSSSITLNWANSGTDQIAYQHLILVKEAGAFPNPTDGSFITNDLDLSTGTVDQMAINLGFGVNSFVVTGLNSGTSYDFEIYPYTNDGSNVNYKTTVPATLTQSTPVAAFTTINFVSTAATISSLVNTSGAASTNFSFTIWDDGQFNSGADNAKTLFTQLRITQGTGNNVADWTTVIAGAELIAEGETATGTINSSNITFSGLSTNNDELGEVDDDEQKLYSLRIWLLTTLPDGVDNRDLVFEMDASDVINNLVLETGSSGIDPASNNTNSGDANNIIEVIATDLTWSNLPITNVGVESVFSTSPTITATDANGNRDADYVNTIDNLTNPGGIVMNNSPVGSNFATGSFTFSPVFSYQAAGNGTLTLTSGALNPSPASNTVTVSYSDNTTIVRSLVFNEPATLTSINSNFVQVGEFTITDDDTGVTIDDNAPTLITQIVVTAQSSGANPLTADWSDVIERAALATNGGGSPFLIVLNANISSNSITFSGIQTTPGELGYFADDSSREVELWIELKTLMTGTVGDIIDTKNIVFNVTTVNVTTATGSSTIAAAQNYISDNTSNVVEVIATQLDFTINPDAIANYASSLPTTPVIQAHDENNNVDRDYIGPLTTTNADGLVMTNHLNSDLVYNNGVITFNANFQFATGGANGANGTLTVSDGTITDAVSTGVVVNYSGLSDITEVTGFGHTSNIDYKMFQENVDIVNSGTSLLMEQFSVRDGGATAPDADGTPTILNEIVLQISNWQNIRRIELYDAAGTTALPSTGVNEQVVDAITGEFITFTGLTLTAPDDGSIDFTVRASFHGDDYPVPASDIDRDPGAVDDNEAITFSVTNVVENAFGSQFEFANAGGAMSNLVADENRIEVVADRVIFTSDINSDPSTFSNIIPSLVIKAKDIYYSTDVDHTGTVDGITTQNFSPVNPLTLELLSLPVTDLPGSFAVGVYDFAVEAPTLQYTLDGANGELLIAAVGLTGGQSQSHSVFSSEESVITFNPASIQEFIPYIDYIIIEDPAPYSLGEFTIRDGGLDGTDADGGNTVLSDLTISLNNPGNLADIALYDNVGILIPGTVQALPGTTVTWNSLSISAPDEGTKNFTIRAFFNTTVTDNQPIDIQIITVVETGGSKFAFSDGADGTGGAQTTLGENIINVTATEFVFTQSPQAIEGVNSPFNNTPIVQAIDVQSNLDSDYDETYTLTPEIAMLDLSSVPTDFSFGVLDLADLRYSTTGYGTLTISGSIASATSGPPQSTDVIDTEFTQSNLGVEPTGTLEISNGNNIAILGFGSRANTNDPTKPLFDGFTIRFNQPVSDFYTNIRVFRSTDNTFNIADDVVITSLNTPGFNLQATGNDVIVTGLSETLIDNVEIFFFIVVDVDASAPQGVPIQASLFSTDIDIAVDNGSVTPFSIIGNSIDIIDLSPSQIISLIPLGENVSADTDLTIIFDEPVFSFDNLVSLYLNTGGFVQDIPLSVSTVEPSNTLVFDIPPGLLLDDTDYYVLIAPGNNVTLQGIADEEGNLFDGIISPTIWAFKTADADPPVFQAPTPELSFVYTQGFDIKVNMDEPSRVYYMVIEDASFSGTPPTIEELIRRDLLGNPIAVDYTGSFEKHDTLVVTQELKDFYASITNLTNNTDYTVYYTAVDIAENRILDPAPNLGVTTLNSSPAGILYSNPSVAICSGDYQEITEPIHIMEGVNSDFSAGNGQTLFLSLPSGKYEFKDDIADLPEVEYLISGDISAQPTIEIVNGGLVKITLDVAGGNSGLDRLTITNLKVKAQPDAVSGDFIKITGSMLDVPDNQILAQFSLSPEVPALFTLQGGSTTISDINEKIALLVDPSLEDSGINLFSGNGVTGDTLYVNIAGIGTHDITLVHTTDFGCISNITQEILIFDNTQVINGLSPNYCSDNFNPASDEANLIGNNNNPAEGLNLIGLTIDLAQTDTTINTMNIIDATIAPSSWAINFDNAGIGQIAFTGEFQNRSDGSISFRTQFVTVADPPTLTLEITGNDALEDGLNYCEDDGIISIFGIIESFNSAFSYTQTLGFDFDMNGVADSNIGLTDNGDGTGEIDPFDLSQNNPDFSVLGGFGVEFDLLYTVTNLTTTCDSIKTARVIINSKPTSGFTNIVGCADRNVLFDNLSNSNGASDVLTYSWDFDDPDNDAFANNDNIVTEFEPAHIFDLAATYNVKLSTSTDKGCVSDIAENPISIGDNPVTSFEFEQVAIGTPTTFTNTTPSTANAALDSLVWTIDGVFAVGFNNGFANPYDHPGFVSIGSHEVVLTAITDRNCAVNDTLNFFTVPEFTLSDITIYDEDFDDAANLPDNGGWLTWGNNSSWAVGTSGGDSINSNSNFWVTGVGVLHNNDEESFVYSPVFNITDLARPMLQLLKYTHLNTSDGVVIEYTVQDLFGNSTNGVIGAWELLGTLNSGDLWYDFEGISNIGGNQQTGQFGWSGSDQDWRNSKHTLGQAKANAVDQSNARIQFRLSFKSGSNNFGQFNGFAFDDVLIGNRTRTVLLENFTSMAGGTVNNTENTAITTTVNDPTGAELIVINYHTSFDGVDILNLDNPSESAARALYYGISANPRVAIDGNTSPDGTTTSNLLFTEWGPTFYSRRTLAIAPFAIDITAAPSAAGQLSISTDLTAKSNGIGDFIVHVVVVEDSINASAFGGTVNSGETEFYNTMRKMLPTAAGTRFTGGLAMDDQVNVSVNWNPTNTLALNPGNIGGGRLSVIVFIQDELTREIHQAEIVPITEDLVLALEQEFEKTGIALYPNPADKQLTIQLAKSVVGEETAIIFDNTGRRVEEVRLNPGQSIIELSTTDYQPGVYMFILPTETGTLRKRFIISHQ